MLSGASFVVVYIVGSILSSVLIVMCSKELFECGFAFPLTMSSVAYAFTYLYYKVLELSGAWKPQGRLSRSENIKVALSSIGSISFMNLCLLTNTVSIYQICKFAIIPCTLVMQKFVFGVNTNWKVLMSLALVLGGVAYSTFKGLEAGNLSNLGVFYAILAVVFTSVYRIWQETKQKEFKLSSVDFQATFAGVQAVLGFLTALFFEFLPVESFGDWERTVPHYLAGVSNQASSSSTLLGVCGWLVGVCCCALTVNFTSFGLIGKTGPIAYAVVGHGKTVLTIFMGIVMFRSEDTKATIRADIIGCVVALFGVIAYTHFEYCLKNKKEDIIAQYFPASSSGLQVVPSN